MHTLMPPTESEFHQAIALRGDQWYAACLRITRNPELANDAVQDALLNAWRKRDQFQGGAQLTTWIHRIAVNSALSLVRAQHPERWACMDEEAPVASQDAQPDRHRQEQEINASLGQAMNQLSELERVCFVLKHLEQWRLQEIADELDNNLGMVKQAVFRAVKKLRVSMADLRSVS